MTEFKATENQVSHDDSPDREELMELRADAERWTPEDIDEKLRETAQDFDFAWASLVVLIGLAKERDIHTALGFNSWPEYIADVTRRDMPNISRMVEQRRQVVELLAGEGMSQRAIADAVGVQPEDGGP